MKSVRLFLLAVALFASQYLSAQSLRVNTYTDVLGNNITEYRDNHGCVVRKECVAVDVLGNVVMSVYDEYGRRIEEVTYQKDILGATIITIRNQYGAVVEKIKYSTDIFGRAETVITDCYGKTVRFNDSHFYSVARRYGDYARYCNHKPAPHDKRKGDFGPKTHRQMPQSGHHPQQPAHRPPKIVDGSPIKDNRPNHQVAPKPQDGKGRDRVQHRPSHQSGNKNNRKASPRR